jgi:hypothetical protein
MGSGMGQLAQQGGGLFVLKFSHDDEKEADLIGMELAARLQSVDRHLVVEKK